jgi:DNA-binding SARP family transcriptional activator/tetratricopeptide (TPR) repeat protein
MIELHTFGRVELKSSNGHEIRAVLAQPKRAALLAYLAAAQPKGFQRRDALLALFWPDLDQEHARAALRKAVHHLRKALGDDAIEGRGDEELRLDGRVVWCDVTAFEAALDAGDAEAAIALYRGRFLEAFFVPDAPEFEQWMELERARLHRRAFEAAWRVAEEEEKKGNGFGAAYWARRASALAPTDEEAIRRLMTLLDRLGDRAGALQAYDEFSRRIEAELDIEPSAETQAVARGIRASSAGPPAEPEIAPEPKSAPEPAAPPAPARSVPATRMWFTVAAGLALVAAAGTGAILRGRGAPPAGISPDVVAVFPFTLQGDRSLAYLEDGLSSLLSTGMDGAGSIRSVDPQVVLTALSREAGALRHPGRLGRLAASLGARFYVAGEVVAGGPQLRIDARLYDVARQNRRAGSATAQGPADSLFSLVDGVAAQLIAAQRGDSARAVARLAALTTHSVPALKAYLEGDREFRYGRFARAIAGFQRAVTIDSTFALAWYQLAGAYAWSANDSSLYAAQQAVRFGRRLPASERGLLDAMLLFEQGRADEAETMYREILRRRPQELDALFQLGEVLFHQNGARGRSLAESRPYFERAREWNHGDAPLIHLAEVVALERDWVAYDSLVADVKPGSHFWLTGRVVRAFQLGSEKERAAAEAEIRAGTERDLATVAGHSLYLVEDDSTAARVVRILVEPTRSLPLRVVGYILTAHLQMSAGRWREASAALEALQALDPVRAAQQAGVMYAGPWLPIPRSELERVHAMVAKAPPEGAVPLRNLTYRGDDTLHAALRTYALGLLEARLGRPHEALGRAAALQTEHATLAAGIRAQVRLLEGDPAGVERELRARTRSPTTAEIMSFSPLGLRHERFVRAEALERLGRHEEAIGWLASYDEHSAAGRIYLAPGWYRRGEILERLGRPREAAAAYARFIRLWQGADPEFQGMVANARNRLEQLSSE